MAVRFDREEQGAEETERQGEPEPAPADPHALLALQRGAGNAAVGRVLSRFYTKEADGSLFWRKEPFDKNVWERTTWTTWNLIPFGVYERKVPELVADEVLDTTKKKRRRGPRKKKVTAETAEQQTAETELEEERTDEADEPTAAETQADPPARMEEDDGGGWTEVRSDTAVRDERDQNADIPTLVAAIDAHEGDPAGVSDRFNGLFRACKAQGLPLLGAIADAYTTSFDRGRRGYSIEVTIPFLPQWVVHAHLNQDGTIAPGDNATHYKRRADRHLLGASITLLPKQIAEMVPDEATCLAARTRRPHGTL